MLTLGISAYYHNSAVALLKDGEILFCCEEERISRKKNDPAFPKGAIKLCLDKMGIRPTEISTIVFYEKPFLKFERLVETYLAFAPRGFTSFRHAMPIWLSQKLFLKKVLSLELIELGFNKKQTQALLFSEHHLSHAASAFFASGFSDAAILTMDGVGELETTTIYYGTANKLKKLWTQNFPHSLGLLYSSFTYYCGFKVNSGEYKLMGLAPYGKPRFAPLIKTHLIDLKSDGSFKLNMKYFDFATGLKMTNEKFNKLFQGSLRKAEEPIQQVHMDIAASIQVVLEEVVLRISNFIKSQTNAKNLCLAGGVSLNCAANGKLLEEKIFDQIWVQPAAGDAGGALGAALAAYHIHHGQPRHLNNYGDDLMRGAYLGPQYNESEIENALINSGLNYKKLTEDVLIKRTAETIADQKTVALYQGRLEFGPRSLGNRSILADARDPNMQKTLNLKIKFRESFRPFAPIVLEEDVASWFENPRKSPYMLFLHKIKSELRLPMRENDSLLFGIEKLNLIRSSIPAVTHLDYTARIQTVGPQTNPRLHKLLTHFKKITGTPILVNTSFNIRGEPIVNSPGEAIRCFLGTQLDVLVLENFFVRKDQQPPHLLKEYQNHFELD